MALLKPFTLLSLFACIRSHEIFTDTVPKDYYLRKDLTDCSGRFHKPKIFQHQCLVFGGVQANVTEFPHMAVLGWPEPGANGSSGRVQWQCGGTLITERFVLTAAHCAADSDNIPPRLVRLGDVNLASSVDDEYAQQFEIRQIVRHPKHVFSRKYFDLALVELDGVARLTAGVCPACLWPKQSLPADVFETAGFGATSFGGSPVPNLLKTYLRTMDSAACTKLFTNTRGLSDGITPDQTCAFEFAADTCQGDSGGPLQISLQSFRSTQPFVVGLTSFGRGCGTGSSGVYQRVASHIPWIESVVNETMDPVRCTKKYRTYRLASRLTSECAIRNAYRSRVNLVWPAEAKVGPIPCSGTLIDYNTVVTSASCVKIADGVQPIGVEMPDSFDDERAQIVEIQVHPEFNEKSLQNDLALLRLDKYLQPDEDVAPSCIPLPKPKEICTDQQTYDPVACWNQFAMNTKTNLRSYACDPLDIERSTVELVWINDDGMRPCVGMLIKPDTVITSIRCMRNHSNDPPVEIELTGSNKGKRVKITKILQHPGYKEGPRGRHDTALLLLSEELIDRKDLVPRCIQEVENWNITKTQVSTFGNYTGGRYPAALNLPTKGVCNATMLGNFKDFLGNSLVNDSRFSCWDTERKIVPGAVPLQPGAGLLDETHRFIHGVVAFPDAYGSIDPVISTNLSAYTDWITRFVLYRPPKVEIVFRAGTDEFELGSECTLKNGTKGNCMSEYLCGREITAQKDSGNLTICGFEGSVSYVCCPLGYQDFKIFTPIDIPLVNAIDIPDFDPLPPLPYENLNR